MENILEILYSLSYDKKYEQDSFFARTERVKAENLNLLTASMTGEQKIFWKEVQKIQDYVVNVSLLKIAKYDDMEKFLNDVTYETIYEIMELLDGHKSDNLRGEILDRHTGSCINLNTQLHDYCEEYLNCSNI